MKSFIQHITRGGLTEPTYEWSSQVLDMRRVFNIYHGVDTLRKEVGVIKNCSDFIVEYFPSVHFAIVQCFTRVLTFARMKWLNNKQKETKLLKRRQRINKMRKFDNTLKCLR
jgi:hypothetical protein